MNRKESLQYFVNHNNTSLPYCIEIDSEKKGPIVMIVGATHGNEPVGVQAMIKYLLHLNSNNIKPKHGKLIFVIGNPFAFEADKRFIDTNLNRSFIDKPRDDLEGRRALEIKRFLKDLEEINDEKILLDLHSVSVGDFKIAVCSNVNGHYQRLNNLTQLENHFTFDYPFVKDTLIEEANKHFNFSYAIECGNNTDIEAFNSAIYHINILLKKYEMIKSEDFLLSNYRNPFELDPNLLVKHYSTIEFIKPRVGFEWKVDNVITGTQLKKGQIYATAKNFEYVAPKNCVICMPDRNPHPNDTDAGFLCDLKLVEPKKMEATTGFEPVYKVLQTSA